MAIHDWTRVDAGIFHDFHHAWIEEIKRSLNRGLLPPDYYALAEQITSRLGPDVLTLRKPKRKPTGGRAPAAIASADAPPKVRFHARAESGIYAAKAKTVVVRHRSRHEVIALVEIVSPGNKDGPKALSPFLRKAQDALTAGIHLLIVDLLPPTACTRHGIHKAVWEDRDDAYTFSPRRPLTCVAYLADEVPEAFIDPVAVGDSLPEMPLFLTPEQYVNVPLESTYQSAWDAVPSYWQDVVEGRQ